MPWSAVLPAFFASLVEFVEALTIVLAIGVSINWKSSLWGAAAAAVSLAVLIGLFGTTLVLLVPLEVLRLLVGLLLVLFGLQWMKKSLLRFSGLKGLHDEAAIYQKELSVAKSRGDGHREKFSRFGFATSFKSVLLEGLEVAFIVITFGTTSSTDKASGLGAAGLGASIAFFVVLVLGLTVRKPLTKVPENTLKFVVGVMLVTFGTFWAGEGLGVEWPLADLFLVPLLGAYSLGSFLAVRWLRTRVLRHRPEASPSPVVLRWLKEIFDFFCGDWVVFWGLTISLGLVAGLRLWETPRLQSTIDGTIFVLGIFLSLVVSLWTQTTKGEEPKA